MITTMRVTIGILTLYLLNLDNILQAERLPSNPHIYTTFSAPGASHELGQTYDPVYIRIGTRELCLPALI